MKGFSDMSEFKKSTRVRQFDPTKSYSEIHKSPIKHPSSSQQSESYFVTRWGKVDDGRDQPAWTNIGQAISQIAAGEDHVLMLNNKNELFGVGSNLYGQLGFQTLTPNNSGAMQDWRIAKPTQIPLKDSKVIAISCGAHHSFIQTVRGQVYGFGLNIKGQLGTGCLENKRKPTLIGSLLPGGIKNPRSASCLDELRRNGSKRSNGVLTELQGISNLMARLKIDTQQKESNFLLNVDEYVLKFACGPLHSLVLTNKNRLFSCGYGDKYCLGNGKKGIQRQFGQVRLKSSIRVQKIEAGVCCSAIISNGKVYLAGTLGDRVYEQFTHIGSNDQLVSVKLTEQSAVVLNRKGDLFVYGHGRDAREGAMQRIDRLSPIKNIYSGTNHYFALSQNRSFYGWGENSNLQITGVEDQSFINEPKQLLIPVTVAQTINIVPTNLYTYLLTAKPLETDVDVIPFTETDHTRSKVRRATISGSSEHKRPTEISSSAADQPRSFNRCTEIDFSQLTLDTQIAQGGYGVIYKGTWRETTVAVKMFKIQTDGAVKDFFSECAAMEALRHPNIVMFLGACTKSPNFAIVLEYCNRGALWTTIQNLEIQLSWQDRRRFALDTAKGVHYLHSSTPPIIHRDLKSLNLLLDDSYHVKLADFGWTRGLDNYMTGKIGTYQWMAPQVIASQRYSEKADVFSFGIILWEIASRQPPFKHLSGLQVSIEVLNNDLRPAIPKKTPQAFARLMKRCWEREPSKRPSFKEIIRELQCMKL